MNETKTSSSKQVLSPCATCPWRKKLHGTAHPSGWYKLANLKRLWNGLRSGNAPGMICHSTDPDAAEYGGSDKIKPGNKRECAGWLILADRELKALEKADTLKAYRSSRRFPFGKYGFGTLVEKIVFGPGITLNMEEAEEIGLPFEQETP